MRVFFSNRSKVYRSLKKYDAALNDALKAKTGDSTSVSFLNEYAELIVITQNKSKALPFFTLASQLKPKSYLELLLA
jgi:hypothetical protein